MLSMWIWGFVSVLPTVSVDIAMPRAAQGTGGGEGILARPSRGRRRRG